MREERREKGEGRREKGEGRRDEDAERIVSKLFGCSAEHRN